MAITLANAIMQHYFGVHEIYHVLHCDQQSSCVDGVMKALNKKLRIQTQISTAYFQRGIGSAERGIRTIEKALKSYIEAYPHT
jgi:hypothetical protein